MNTMKKITLLLSVLTTGVVFCQTLEPGVDRWSIKTSIISQTPKNISIATLLGFANPSCDGIGQFSDTRMATNIGATDFKEGDIVVTQGWLHLVALENSASTHRDGDYHIQLSNSAESGDNCLIVEIPDPDFINDAALKAKCTAARAFVKTNLLNGQEPGTRGNIMQHQVYVQVRGQLFADLTHCKNNNRGKGGMHSANIWEIHPVTDISFAVKPI
jgi:hypothetical protein